MGLEWYLGAVEILCWLRVDDGHAKQRGSFLSHASTPLPVFKHAPNLMAAVWPDWKQLPPSGMTFLLPFSSASTFS